jgi:hypothetical protein
LVSVRIRIGTVRIRLGLCSDPHWFQSDLHPATIFTPVLIRIWIQAWPSHRMENISVFGVLFSSPLVPGLAITLTVKFLHFFYLYSNNSLFYHKTSVI